MAACGTMRYALVDGVKRLPEKNLWGVCPVCGNVTISKCGTIVVHHWAHKAGSDCDPWAEPIGPWHLSWQDLCPLESVEVVIGPHRADIVGKGDAVVELQHSSIGAEEIAAREKFYGNMVWLFDATERFEMVTVGQRVFFALRRLKHIGHCTKPVYLDFGNTIVEVECFSKAVTHMSGFGLTRSRRWLAERILFNRAPPNLNSDTLRWLKDRRYSRTEFPTQWNDPAAGSVVTIPKGTLHLPLVWYENRTPPVYEWERVIEQHEQLANGWTKPSLESMERFLGGKVMILDGLLRLMPAPVGGIPAAYSAASAETLLAEAERHIATGRIPILKDATKERILQIARQNEPPVSSRRKSAPPNRSLF